MVKNAKELLEDIVAEKNGHKPSSVNVTKAVEKLGVTKVLADAIGKDNRFATDLGGKLYRYNEGTYRKDAQKYIQRRTKELMEEWGLTTQWSSYRCEEVVKYIMADAPELWERPPFDEVNLQNGILNVVTKELRDHSPDFLSPVQIPISYDPEATCPAWEEYVEPCFPDDAPTLPYEIFASVITPYRATQKAVLLLGEGANGKSTYLAAVMKALGRANCTSVTLQKLETDRFSVARLVGKLANVCPDLPSTHLQETSVFKALTGDEGQLTGEYKHKDSFEFEPYCQLVFSANHPPKSADASHAFFRRWVVAPFDKTFDEADEETIPREELDLMLAAPMELSGMLNKALEALPKLRREGFTESESMRRAWEEFRTMTDPVSVWLARNTVQDPEAYVVKKVLHKAYNDTADQTLTEKAFSQAVKRSIPGVGEGKRTVGGGRENCWIGVGLKSPDNDPKNPRSHGPGTSLASNNNGWEGVQGVQHVQGSSNCNEKAPPLNLEGGSSDLCNKEKPGHPGHPGHDTQNGAGAPTPRQAKSTRLTEEQEEVARLKAAGWRQQTRARGDFWLSPRTGYAYNRQYALEELDREEEE